MLNLSAIFSSENVIVALIGLMSGAIGGAIGSIIAPLVNWKIEQKRQTRAYREAQIQKWRQMVQQVILELDKIKREESPPITGVRSPAAYLLDRHADFSGLKPLLPQSAVADLYVGMTIIAGPTIDSKLVRLLDEIAKIEEKWGLR
jgi:hypothetical protein